MKLSDMARIQEILYAYPTLKETQEVMAKEFPSVVVSYNNKKQTISAVDKDDYESESANG